ncbi:MAG: RecX family transcriptional regulator [Phycisphaerales bacterium]|nr:RecX family transcriptional regulator [Phycisphaerales bacterium]
MTGPSGDSGRAMKAAVRALARGPLTVADLRERLAAKFAAGVADRVIADLRRQRLLSDEAAADAIAHARRRRGYSSADIERRLTDRGIDRATAQGAARAAAESRADGPLAFDLALARVRTAPADLAPDVIRRRVFAWLARRGYPEDLCRDAVERAIERLTRS